MPTRKIQTLLVEDDPVQRRLMSHFLAAFKDYDFVVDHAESEDAAVKALADGHVGLVLLDYHLTQGDGLNCLRRMRQLDPLVPIIAISGTASPEIAAELLQANADDFFDKQHLTGKILIQGIRDALARVDAWYQQNQKAAPEPPAHINELFRDLCRDFAAAFGTGLVKQIDDFEEKARQAKLSVGQLNRLFDTFCKKLDAGPSLDGGMLPARRLLRPIFLEVVMRLFGDQSSAEKEKKASEGFQAPAV